MIALFNAAQSRRGFLYATINITIRKPSVQIGSTPHLQGGEECFFDNLGPKVVVFLPAKIIDREGERREARPSLQTPSVCRQVFVLV